MSESPHCAHAIVFAHIVGSTRLHETPGDENAKKAIVALVLLRRESLPLWDPDVEGLGAR